MTLADDLRVGMPGPSGSTIRWRRRSDSSSTLNELITRAVGEPFPADHPFLDPAAGSAVRIGAARGPEGVIRQFAGKSIDDLIVGYFAVLVAEVDGRVVGASFTAPPPTVLDLLRPDQIAPAVMQVVKLGALSVQAEYTNRGIATELMATVRSVYTHCRAAIMYGEFDRDQAKLETFYRDRGFDLLGPNDLIDLSPLLGTDVYVEGNATEQLFARRILDDYPFPVVKRRSAAFSRDGSTPRRPPTPPPTAPQPVPSPEPPTPARPRRFRWWKRS